MQSYEKSPLSGASGTKVEPSKVGFDDFQIYPLVPLPVFVVFQGHRY
jgi:hypothetical protein